MLAFAALFRFTYRSPPAGRARLLTLAIKIPTIKLKITTFPNISRSSCCHGAVLTPDAVVLKFACKERALMALTGEYGWRLISPV